jgi:hypothetical protein
MLAVGLWRMRRLGLIGGAAPAGEGDMMEAVRRVLRIAVPAAATNAIIPVATGIYTSMVAAHGPAAVAGFALGSRAEALAMTAFFALSAIANPFAAQNAGAGRMDRVQAGIRAALAFCAGFGCWSPCRSGSARRLWRGCSPRIRRSPPPPRSTSRSCPGASARSAPSPSSTLPSTGWSGRWRPSRSRSGAPSCGRAGRLARQPLGGGGRDAPGILVANLVVARSRRMAARWCAGRLTKKTSSVTKAECEG